MVRGGWGVVGAEQRVVGGVRAAWLRAHASMIRGAVAFGVCDLDD